MDEEGDDNPLVYKMKWETGYLNGAPIKMELVCNFYIGEVITSLNKVQLFSTGSEVIAYSTSMGTIGVLLPFETREVRLFWLLFRMSTFSFIWKCI